MVNTKIRQAAYICVAGALLFATAAVSPIPLSQSTAHPVTTCFMTADSHIYAGVKRQLFAPKIDAKSNLIRLSNLEIPPEQADVSTRNRDRDIVEISGVIEDPVTVIYGEITEHVPMPADLSKIPSNVPNVERGCKSDVKTHMSYRAITCKSSPQYALQQEAITDTQSNIRMADGCYLVAVGTYYADHIGQKIRVTMSSGLQVMCMVGEFKSDYHTDPTHRYHVGGYENGIYYKGDGSVLEFITDRGYSPDQIPDVFDGTIHNITVVQD